MKIFLHLHFIYGKNFNFGKIQYYKIDTLAVIHINFLMLSHGMARGLRPIWTHHYKKCTWTPLLRLGENGKSSRKPHTLKKNSQRKHVFSIIIEPYMQNARTAKSLKHMHKACKQYGDLKIEWYYVQSFHSKVTKHLYIVKNSFSNKSGENHEKTWSLLNLPIHLHFTDDFGGLNRINLLCLEMACWGYSKIRDEDVEI